MSESINRAFMYGESVFTTMRMIDGHICDWDLHFERLKKGVDFVYGPLRDDEDWVIRFKARLEDRTEMENGDKVVRLTIYRDQHRGLARVGLDSINDLRIHLSASLYDPHRSEGQSIALRSCTSPVRPHWWPSFLKAGSYLETILNQKMFLQPGDDDLLFLSPEDTVLESSVANIFVVRHNKLYTAPLGPNVLDGIMRKKVIGVAEEFFEEFIESESSLEQLYKADAVFGTNSVRGPFLIEKIDGHNYTSTSDFLQKFEKLRKKVMG